MRREFSAGGLVSRRGRVLLVRVRNLKGQRVWTFPKGHLEKGETALAAALREVQEETGWRCRSRRPLLEVAYRFRREGRPVAKRVRWFWMEPLKKDGRPDQDEVLSVRWTTPEGARRLLSYPSDFALLDRWQKTATAPHAEGARR